MRFSRQAPGCCRRRVLATLTTLLLLLSWASMREAFAEEPWTRRELLDAIRQVESSGRAVVPDGDNGRAIGPYQIHESYWRDALAAHPEIGGRYEDCRQPDYAEKVIAAYMEKWVPDAWRSVDAEAIARTHNGGPSGASKPGTLRYWERVRAARR